LGRGVGRYTKAFHWNTMEGYGALKGEVKTEMGEKPRCSSELSKGPKVSSKINISTKKKKPEREGNRKCTGP